MDPVKVILSTSGCLTRYAPISPNPLKIWKTPGGNPTSTANYPILKAERGVFSEVFKIETHPVAATGPHFQAYINNLLLFLQ